MKYIIMAIILLLSFTDGVENKDIGIWFREVSHPTTGKPIILELDMRYGYAVSDGGTIYIVVVERITGREIKLTFTNGDFFTTTKSFWHKDSFENFNNGECVGEDIQSHLKKGIPLEKNKK
jgi:hypothetical protein